METFVPRHNTPLYDAIGQTIDDTGRFLDRLGEPARPPKVVFVIVTDGLENASQLFSAVRVRQMIQHQTQVYKWEFVFIGANIDSYAIGQNIGIGRAQTMNFAANDQGVRTVSRPWPRTCRKSAPAKRPAPPSRRNNAKPNAPPEPKK